MGSLDRALGLRPDPQPVGPRPHPRRLRRRLGGGGRGVRGAARGRHRHRRLDPAAGRRHRHGRRQADVRRGVPLRPGRALVLAGPGRALRPHRPGRRAAARDHRRPRPARLDLDRRRRSRRSSRPPAARTSPACASASSSSSAARATRPASMQRFHEAVELLSELGAEVVEVDCPHFEYALPAYYLIVPSECSSNLARFDAMRYGLRVGDDGTASAEDVMSLTRDGGLRRRGQAAHHARHLRAVQRLLRRLLRPGAEGAHPRSRATSTRRSTQADVLVSPTTPTTAFRIGERVDDPMAMYLADLCTIPSNLAGNAVDVAAGGPRARGRPAGRPADDGPADGRRPALPGGRRARGRAAPTGGATC